ncbi:class I SAM-dependent DNA methyltransferase [Flavobacteriaceae bacterium]|nr:class I SAM-dependent DNA methyltransferase [Flavobacteriaceae bacterium]
MNITQIEKSVTTLLKKVDNSTFIYDLLLAYGKPKSSIKRLQSGNLNMSKNHGELSWKKEVFYKTFEGQLIGADDLDEILADALKNIKHKQRFVIVTDFNRFLALDTKTIERLDIDFKDLAKHYAFFLPWTGMEKAQHIGENPADVKAAERMAKLFDELKKDNPDEPVEAKHDLNVFLSRLLFCLFAEDTNIFEDNLFSNSIDSHTAKDGSDTHTYLARVFDVLNLPEGTERNNLPEHLQKFPYVNGGLFSDTISIPEFSKKSRQILIDAGAGLDWKDINPDIFGSMFQAVIAVDQRGTLGQHYTSVPNIMKVIQPLFLDELYEAYEDAKGNEKKINELLLRLGKIKIFDPACGSGNFLIIAYKELRKLEMLLLKEKANLKEVVGLGNLDFGNEYFSQISLSQFYGIEIDDFAHEIAILALWLAEHQMNVEFFNEFGRTNPTLPLKAAGNIEQGNACRLDWEEVCPKEVDDEIYILGNPPYVGSSMQSKSQKDDLSSVLSKLKSYKNLDYIAVWFYKGAKFIENTNAQVSFVSTNSICQGEQVGLLWPSLLSNEKEIGYAYPSFVWSNSAKAKAAVIVIIVSIRNKSKHPKFIINRGIKRTCKNINPYLKDGGDIYLYRRSTPISNFPEMMKGNYATDGGYLILTTDQKDELISNHPNSKKFLKKYVGSQEYINNIDRWCLWIDDSELPQAVQIPEINSRIEKVEEFRLQSKAPSTRLKSKEAHRFIQIQSEPQKGLIVPSVSSERRNYIPVGFVDKDTVVNAQCLVSYDSPVYMFGIISSQIHMAWTRLVAGRLKNDYRYSSAICFYCFPFPLIITDKRSEIENSVKSILKARANHSELTLAQMYDPDKMPDDLRKAHHQNDILIDSCYRDKPFESDEERLEHLFKLYEKMIAKEQRHLEKEKAKKKPRKRTAKK